ncbi:FeoA domain-containing protein [Streptomyces olivaceus]|uniref:FeoA domain-containing protein n=1 Tax=Streptomyces olivaceus TaxID=47716 RepID=UPI001CCB0615|nr:FeoA domain-containing protein [Streptomyces olivaceus]MBZ6229506.1 FeoA domain-containing protein [Streptomyces olivaceus]
MARLIDTTEMYLRTVLELEEEGVVPMRARIAETESPYGNPIPGLEELGGAGDAAPRPSPAGTTVSLGAMVTGPAGTSAVLRRIGEPVQSDHRLLSALRRAGVRPGAVVSVLSSAGGVTVGSGGRTAELPTRTAAHVFVAPL